MRGEQKTTKNWFGNRNSSARKPNPRTRWACGSLRTFEPRWGEKTTNKWIAEKIDEKTCHRRTSARNRLPPVFGCPTGDMCSPLYTIQQSNFITHSSSDELDFGSHASRLSLAVSCYTEYSLRNWFYIFFAQFLAKKKRRVKWKATMYLGKMTSCTKMHFLGGKEGVMIS